MTSDLKQDLPEALKAVRSRALFVMHLNVRPLQVIGATPGAFRRIGVVPGGVFEGERVRGDQEVLVLPVADSLDGKC